MTFLRQEKKVSIPELTSSSTLVPVIWDQPMLSGDYFVSLTVEGDDSIPNGNPGRLEVRIKSGTITANGFTMLVSRALSFDFPAGAAAVHVIGFSYPEA